MRLKYIFLSLLVVVALASFAIIPCMSIPSNSNAYLSVIGGYNHQLNVDIYDLNTGALFPAASSSQMLVRYGGSIIQNTVYVAGGTETPQNEFFSYDLLSNAWKNSLPAVPVADWVDATLVASGNMLVTLGANSNSSTGMVFSYDPTRAQWTNVTSLPQLLYGVSAASIVVNGSSVIFVTAGFDTNISGVTNNVYQTSDGGNTWTSATPMITARRNHRSTALGTKLYVMGGSNANGSLNSMEIYDTSTGKWQSGPPMTNSREMFGAAINVGTRTILVCGGLSGSAPLSSCEVFSIDQNSWTSGLSLRQPIFGFSMFITNTPPLAVTNPVTSTNQAFCAYPDVPFPIPAASTSHCYRAFTVKMDWPHAVVACQMWGGNIITIDTAAENAFVITLLQSVNESSKAWIGLNSFETFSWDEDNGDVMTSIPSQNQSYPLHCVFISMQTATQGNWFSQECWSSYSFVCEKPFIGLNESAAVTTTTEVLRTTTCSPFGASATCSTDLNKYGMVVPDRGVCLILGGLGNGTTQQSWSAASLQCKQIYDGNLVEVNDAIKSQAVSNLAAIAKTRISAPGAWVGLQSTYRWTNGNKPLSYVPGGSKLVNPTGSCFSFNGDGSNDFGGASSCNSTRLPYICQVTGCPLGMVSVPDCFNTNYVCAEDNECADGKADCGISSVAGICTDLPHDSGRWRCDCQPGFQLSSSGDLHSSCVDIRECDNSATCSQLVNGGLCIEQYGGYLCACKNGYRLTNTTSGSFAALSAQSCVAIDECAENPNICLNGLCNNIAGGYNCTCNGGFQLVNGRCVDINECAMSLYPCGIPTQQAFCYNQNGFTSKYPNGYLCVCPPGFSFTIDNATCVLINNCQPSNGVLACGNDPSARCVNFQNQYYCACDGGQNFDGATQTCVPINLVPLTYGNGTLALPGLQ